MHFRVRAINGCGDHVAAIIEADDSSSALTLAKSLPEFNEPVRDVWEFGVFPHKHERPAWLLDVEVWNHEYQYAEPRLY